MTDRDLVWLATCETLPEPDPDEQPLLGALERAGVDAQMWPWERGCPPPGFSLCVLRSTWNYVHHVDAFERWLANVATQGRLENPLAAVRPNLRKHYLLELAAAGVPTVPTCIVGRGGSFDLARFAREEARDGVVIKPVVGAASFATKVFGRGELDEAEAFLRASLEQRDTMLQPYFPAVESEGEHAVVCIDGEISHAVRKSRRLEGEHESVSAPFDANDEQVLLAEKALATIDATLLYARVDVVRAHDGQLHVMELELVEPSLFVADRPEALGRLAEGIARRARDVTHAS